MTADPDDDLDPDIRRFQRFLADGYAAHPALDSVPLAEARRIVEAVRAPLARGGPVMAERQDLEWPLDGLPAVRLRMHRPEATPVLPALVYLHGGGWVYFSLDTHDRLMREYAARAGRVVIGIGYAQAPEHRFPVALQQVVAVLRRLHASPEALGITAACIALGGDSVGANLALAAALVLRDGGQGQLLQALLLNYGVFDDDDGSLSFRRFDGPNYTLGRDEMRGFWQAYLGDEAERRDPRAQPLRGDLSNLPPALLVAAECDVLRDGSLQLAAALRAYGNLPTLRRYAGATHSFLEAMSFAALSSRALDDSAAWLRLRAAAGAA